MPTRTLEILAVDVRPGDVRLRQSLLTMPGTQLLAADSAKTAIELLDTHGDVAVVLLAPQLDPQDRATLSKALRSSERTHDIPVLLLVDGDAGGLAVDELDFVIDASNPSMLHSKVYYFIELHRQRLLLSSRVAELERLQRLHQKMLSALSHDLRTPLAALSLNAELLARRGDAAGTRIRTATGLLSRQVEHLLNLGTQWIGDVRARPTAQALGELVAQHLAHPDNRALDAEPVSLEVEGNDRVQVDGDLMGQAIDTLLLQSLTHCGGSALQVRVNGQGRHAVMLQFSFGAVLDEQARAHLLGEGAAGASAGPQPLGDERRRLGLGLDLPQRVAHAHGGTLIGQSRDRQGTLFEMMLPRAAGD